MRWRVERPQGNISENQRKKTKAIDKKAVAKSNVKGLYRKLLLFRLKELKLESKGEKLMRETEAFAKSSKRPESYVCEKLWLVVKTYPDLHFKASCLSVAIILER